MSSAVQKFKVILASPLPWYKIIYLFVFSLVVKLAKLVGFLIDNCCFYKYKSTVIKEPVFLIGHPRSGTTFLHRFLLKIVPTYRGMHLWEMLIQSIFWRKLINPIIIFLDKISSKHLYDPKIHKTGLKKAETDDVALFLKSLDGLFFWLYFGSFGKYPDFFSLKKDLESVSNLDKTIENLQVVHKKNLFISGRLDYNMFSKSFSLILDVKKLLNYFPEAKIILLIRDPLEVIPSSMSLIRSVLQRVYRFDHLSKNRKQQFYNNLYNASIIFYRSLDDFIRGKGNTTKEFIVISYKRLNSDFKDSMIELLTFLDVQVSTDIDKAIEKQNNSQKKYRSKHKYSLAEFGLEEEKIRDDFKFIYDKYDV